MKALFLYTEIAGYVLSCLKTLSAQYGVEVHLVRYPVNSEAPFRFNSENDIHLIDRKDHSENSLLKLVSDLNPDFIVCSGWIDKAYVNACRKSDPKIIKILTLDNHWKGTLKQQFARILSRFTLLNIFNYAWVPGAPQKIYARKLGFKQANILTGFYSADFDLFHNIYVRNRESKRDAFPKRFIFSGRYYSFKGIQDLWEVFIEIQNESPNEWELWCMGTGDIEPVKHPKIRHLGFVQPNDMPAWLKQTGVMVLPSHKEPWGVVVHEFAAAGFPLICSDAVGAASTFVEQDFNGYIYPSANKSALKTALKKIIILSSSELSKMGDRSAEKASAITPDFWAKTLLSIIK